jgi:hypothetical protein
LVDTAFTYSKLTQDLGARTARYAVLRPILNCMKKTPLLKLPLLDQHDHLQKMWRSRVVRLASGGWRRAQGKNLQYLRNCPPVGVWLETRPRLCRCRRICPSCYARCTVAEAYKAARWAFFGPTDKCYLDRDLIAVRSSWVLAEPLKHVLTVLKDKGADVHRGRLETTKKRHPGSIVIRTVEPVKEGWKIQVRTLLAVPTGQEVDMGQKSQVKRLAKEKVTGKELSKLVGWATRYPLGMMFGDADRTAGLLNEVATRGWASQLVMTGMFRNAGQRI